MSDMRERREIWKTVLSMVPVAFAAVLTVYTAADFAQIKDQKRYLLMMCAVSLVLSVLFRIMKRRPEKKGYALMQAAVFLSAPLIMAIAVEVLNGNLLWRLKVPVDILLNYLVYLGTYVFFYVLCGSVTVSGMSASGILLVFGIVNMYLKDYKGSPLLPMDLGSVRTAANVASAFSFKVNPRLATAVCLAVMCFGLMKGWKMQKEHKKRQRAERIIGFVILAAFGFVFYGSDTFADNDMRPDFFNQTRGYENHGAYAEFILNTKYLFMSQPDGYSSGEVLSWLEEAENTHASVYETAMRKQGDPVASWTGTDQTPHILVIMDEAFSDLSVIGDFETNIPYMPYLDSLIGQENVIEGNAYVSTIGTGTSNTEFEFLTGNTMAFLPAGSNAYQLYVDHTMPGLTQILKDQDFAATALHPYYRTSWNRPAVYDYMGFDEFLAMDDYPDAVKIRRFISDNWDFHEAARLIRQSKDQPLFLFNITMQNHSSYEIHYENFEERVWVTSTEKEYPETNQYLSLIRQTDDDLKKLITILENMDDPVLLLFFGDHQPFIEDGFYEEVMGEKLNAMSDEKQQKRYISRFLIWANYDIPEGYIDQISVNYLSSLMMEFSGLKTSPYQQYLAKLYEEVPVMTALGCRDFSGEFFQADEKNSHEEAVAKYRKIAYNLLFDKNERIEEFFAVTK